MNDSIPTVPIVVETGAQKTLAIQALLVAGVAWSFYAFQGETAAQAALYGGCIVIVNVWLMNGWVQLGVKAANFAPGREVVVLYLAALQRFIVTLVGFIVGMGWLALPPIPMLIAFAIAQLGYLFNGRLTTTKV